MGHGSPRTRAQFSKNRSTWRTWRCFPVLQLRCALILREPCSGSWRTVLWFSENRALVLREPCSGSRRTVIWFSETVLWFSENRALVLGELCSGSRRTVLWFSENRALVLGEPCSGSRRTVLWFSVLQLRYAPVLQIFGLRVWSRKYLYLYAGSQGRVLWESAASQ